MLRIVLINILLFALPFLIYAAFMVWVKGVAPSNVTRSAPILWLLVAGFVCLFVGIVALVEFSGGERGGTYRPSVIQDGAIKPGTIKPGGID